MALMERSPFENVVYAGLIIGRVKQRVWEVVRDAVEVFVDSALLPHRIPTGDALGDWRLVEEYPQGLHVYGPRCWRAPDGRWVRCSGRPEGKRDVDHRRDSIDSGPVVGEVRLGVQ